MNIRPFIVKIMHPDIVLGYTDSENNLCSNLSGYWKFDTGTGDTVEDMSGTGEILQLTNVGENSWSEDIPSSINFWNTHSYTFSSENYATTSSGYISPLQIKGDLTLSLWINYKSLTPTNTANSLITYGGDVETKTDNILYSLSINGENKSLRLKWENGSDSRDIIGESTDPANIQANTWHHIVAIRNDEQKEIRFIVDGINVGFPLSYSLPPSGGTGGLLYIATSPENLSENIFSGKIDDLRIYNKALSDEQVASLYLGRDLLGGCTCGNNELEPPEECDDGNTDNSDSCTNLCKKSKCGDGYIQDGEECELPGTDTCSANCISLVAEESLSSSSEEIVIPPNCGNRIIEEDEGEECDDGALNGTGECSEYCTNLFCGDGILSSEIFEECEPVPFEVVNGVPYYNEPICGESCSIPDVDSKTGVITGGCKRLFLTPCDVSSSSSGFSDSFSDSSQSEIMHSAANEQPIEEFCGNTITEDTEECDNGGICDGGDLDGQNLLNTTNVLDCINGGGEVFTISDDGCTSLCKLEICGDGIIQANGQDGIVNTSDDEICDNGSICSNNTEVSCASDLDCTFETLCEDVGDGTRSCGGGTGSTLCRSDDDCELSGLCLYDEEINNECTNECKKPAVCGNGIVEKNEECDDENLENNDGCSENCLNEFSFSESSINSKSLEFDEEICGNGIVEGNEECDEGDENGLNSKNCGFDCTVTNCGDGIIDLDEECDNGNQNSNIFPDSCRLSCILPYCGDGIRDSGEDCDGSKGCLENCKFPNISTCGDGILQITEDCDDGNSKSGDGCSNICKQEPKLIDYTSTKSSSSILPIAIESSSSVSSDSLVGGLNQIKSASNEESSSTTFPVVIGESNNQPLPIITIQPPIQIQNVKTANQIVQPVIASVLPIQTAHAPVGATGPGALLLIGIGTVGGFLLKRKRNK